MTNPIFILLFVLFPPPEIAAADPGAPPYVQSAQVVDLDTCKVDFAKATATALAQYPGAISRGGCIAVDSPDYALVVPGLQKDGSIVSPDGSVTSPKGPI